MINNLHADSNYHDHDVGHHATPIVIYHRGFNFCHTNVGEECTDIYAIFFVLNDHWSMPKVCDYYNDGYQWIYPDVKLQNQADQEKPNYILINLDPFKTEADK